MSETARILIADDEPLYLRTTAALLRKAGYHCTGAPDGKSAIRALEQESFDLLLSDLSMPGNLKFELLQAGRGRWPDMPLIVITGAPSLPSAIESVRLGITDYLLKPVRYEDLLSSVRRALAGRPHTIASRQDSSAVTTIANQFPEIIGDSPPTRELFEIIDRVAGSNANILITGESGTGKEVAARAIHRVSQRSSAPFQVIDCTAVPETLFESVLFGHKKGAFTGAIKDQIGLLNQADGGTTFFDEIGELPMPLQAKLLRVIQQQTFTPLGQTTPIQVDTRILCATNRNLEQEVNAGRFRRDLFYRLAVIHIELPPLRERGDDILLLARHFLQQLQGSEQYVRDFSSESIELLRHYDWPGNIRELRNVVERAIVLTRTAEIPAAALPLAIRRGVTAASRPARVDLTSSSRSETLDSAERDFLDALLRENGGNVAQCARQAKMSRQGLHKILKKHGIVPSDYRS